MVASEPEIQCTYSIKLIIQHVQIIMVAIMCLGLMLMALQISETQGAFTSAVANGNSQFAPFNIIISQGVISNNLIEIAIKIIRDPTDVTIIW
ncbi:MAG: hypothetical protein MZV64_26240 [Ignavibacteriales bacterium]|nr:hypothetical protein [Ignavibacteriales bacterium]